MTLNLAEYEVSEILKRSELIILVTDGLNTIHEYSQNWEEHFGHTQEELSQLSLADIIHPEDLKRTLKTTFMLEEQDNSKCVHFYNRILAKDGSITFVAWSAYKKDGKIYSIGKDLTPILEGLQNWKEKEVVSEKKKVLDRLTPTESKLFAIFLSNLEKPLDKKILLNELYSQHSVNSQALNVHIYKIRRKIKDTKYQIILVSQGRWKLIISRNDNELF